MVEFLSPGIIITEQPAQTQVTQGVSTSNGAFIGFTPKGMVDEATLVTSYDDYVRKFGGDNANSGTTMQVRGFYQNGGRRAFIVRVVPSDAVAADVGIQSQITDQSIETGDGSDVSFVRTGLPGGDTPLLVEDGASPIIPASLALRWRGSGTPTPTLGEETRTNDLTSRVELTVADPSYSARIDPKAGFVVASSGPGFLGKVLYRSVVTGQTNIKVAHVIGAAATSTTGIAFASNTITVNVGTPAPTLTAADLKTAIENNSISRAYLAVDVLEAGIVNVTLPASNLERGLPDFDEELETSIVNTVKLRWNPDNTAADREIVFPTAFGVRTPEFWVVRNPTQTALDTPIANGATIIINDGINPATTFEFRTSGPVTTPGNVLVSHTTTDTAAAIQAAFITAVAGVGSTLLVTAVAAASAEATFARTYFTHDSGGTITFTSSDADLVVGTRVQYDHRNSVASVNFGGTDIPSALGTGLREAISVACVLAGLTDNETLIINDGINPAVTFEYQVTGGFAPTGGGVQVINVLTAASDQDVALATVAAINGYAGLAVTAAFPVAGLFHLSQNYAGVFVVTATGTAGFATLPVVVGTRSKHLRMSYTPTLAPIPTDLTVAPTAFTASSNTSSQLLSGNFAGPGTINYSTGAYTFTTTAGAAPYNGGPILANYKIKAWTGTPISKGVWANDIRLQVTGTQDFLTASTATYSKYTVQVQGKDPAETKLPTDPTAVFSTLETFEGVDFSDSASPQFFPDVINELSDLVRITTPGGNRPVNQLNGIARVKVIAGGDALTTAFYGTLPYGAIYARSVSISYRDNAGVVRTITDDGYGVLGGAVNPGYATTVNGIAPNTIVYSSGAFNFQTDTATPPAAGSLVVVSYRSTPAETQHREVFGDTAKGYTAGSDGTFTTVTYGQSQLTSPVLSPDYRGIYALDRIDELMQVVLPDYAGDIPITLDLLNYAAGRANQPSGPDRFMILTTPKNFSAQRAVDWFKNDLSQYSKYAAMYWPWVNVANVLANNRPITIPPLGIVAGIYARTDTNRNVAKSPGGTVDGAIVGILGLEYKPTQGDRDYVYPNRINPLIDTPQTGRAVWGVRTMASPSETEWRYINARRLFMFLGKSIFNSTHWIVFENNGPGLWTRIKGQLDGFMSGLFGLGYFAGTTPTQAYKVVVDTTNNTAATMEQGLVIIDVGAAPHKPAEIALFRLSQLSTTA